MFSSPRIDETTTTTTTTAATTVTTRNHRTTDAHFQLRLYHDHATCSSFELLSKNTAERRARRFEPYETNAMKRVTQVPTGDSRSLSLVSFSLCPPRSYTYTIHNVQPKRNFVQKTLARSEGRGIEVGGEDRKCAWLPRPRTTNYEPRTTDCEPRTTDYEQRTTDYGLRITDHGSRTTDHGLRITDHGPWRDDLASLPSSPDHSYPLVRYRRLGIFNPAVVVYSLFLCLFPSALYTSIIKPKRSPSNQSFQFNFLVNGTDRIID